MALDKSPQTKKDYSELLERAGLTANEAAIYEFLLKNARSSASAVSKKTKLSRSSTYLSLRQLEEKGLVRKSAVSPKSLYSAEHPHAINEFIAGRREGIERAQRDVVTVMASMVSDYELGKESPGVFRFEGRRGMERVYDELIRDGLQVNSIVSRKMLREFIAEYNPSYVNKRRRYKITSRVITPDLEPVSSGDSAELRQVRYLKFGLYPFVMDLKVTKKKVVLTTFKEQSAVGILIIDPVITQHFLALFEFLWGVAAEKPSQN